MIATVIRLNVSWTEDAAKALRNSDFRVMCPSETILAVTVVPTLAPITIKIAPVTSRAPAATRPTIKLVVVEELCTMVVARMPMKSPTIGERVASSSLAAVSLNSPLKAAPMPPIPIRKK